MPWSIRVRGERRAGGRRRVFARGKGYCCRRVKNHWIAYLCAPGYLGVDVGVKEAVPVWLGVWGGEVFLRTREGLYVGYCGSGTVSLLHLEVGRYRMQVKGGRIIVIQGEEGLKLGAMGPGLTLGTELDDFFGEWEKGGAWERLERMLGFVVGKTEQLYERGLKEKLGMWPWRLRKYLDEHFLDPDLSSAHLERHFGIKEYSLRQQFYREFKVSPHEYYTARRLRYYLKNFSGTSPGKCFWECGYHAESTFRYELKRHGVSYR